MRSLTALINIDQLNGGLMMLKHFFDISTGFGYRKKNEKEFSVHLSIETSMARVTEIKQERSTEVRGL